MYSAVWKMVLGFRWMLSDAVGRSIWRKEWDSNPRWACVHGGFQDRCLKPLGHPSAKRQDLYPDMRRQKATALALIPSQRPGENDLSSLAILLSSACPSKGPV